MNLLWTTAAFVVALGVLIVVHEYGHYLVARLCNVKVLRFSVGFGRALFTRRGRDGTEWVVAAVPFGGYVKMLDEREAPVSADELPRAFNRQSVWRRTAIVAAGPVANFLFAIAVYAGLFMYGLPEARPIVGAPPAGSAAAVAGLRAGDTIVAVDGEAVSTWQQLRWRVLKGALQGEQLRLERISEQRHLSDAMLDLRRFAGTEAEGDLLAAIGLQLYRPALAPVLGQVEAGSAADRDGLQAGDRIARIDDVAIDSWSHFVEAVRASPGKPMQLTILREQRAMQLTVTPEAREVNGAPIGRIGAAPHVPPSHIERILIRTQYGLLEAVGRATDKTFDIAVFSLRMLGKMLLGEVSWKHLSGPVTIADYAGQSAQMGWVSYLTFLALISISLGVLNLLPIPLLDGGHLMYYALEVVKGSPVSERVMELGQRVGLTLLLIMMAFAFYNDLNRLFSG
ncbi:MAG: RIP metalloprotease RseP [Betaproteobacteria bacterium SG8_39]|nr:MAG: RIP metalloprotease RseP [Betaproteobacteria bacterium SG8_39]